MGNGLFCKTAMVNPKEVAMKKVAMKFVITVLAQILLLFSASTAPAANSPCPIINFYPPLIEAGTMIYTTRDFEIIEVEFLYQRGNIAVKEISAIFFEIPRECIALRVYMLERRSGKRTVVELVLKPQ